MNKLARMWLGALRPFFSGVSHKTWKSLTTILVCGGLLPCTSGSEEVLRPVSGVDAGYAELIKAGALHQVNHLSNRRRLTTFFVNEQTPFYGVQLNYVNVSRGNLTFLNRDLVRLARIPMVVGRVYDSQPNGQGDFGQGWKLSITEVIYDNGADLRYIDASGSEHALSTQGGQVVSTHPHLTGIEGGRRIGRMIELKVGDFDKRFRFIDDAFYLVEVRSKEGDLLRIDYDGKKAVRVQTPLGRCVEIQREASGRISRIEDDAGRSVSYEYDLAGRLTAVVDVGGRRWYYDYDADGLLTSVIDPRGHHALVAAHAGDGRVGSVRVLYDSMTFEYQAASTTARNAHMQAATFWQDPSGLTTVAQDFAGSVTELVLSGDLRPVALMLNGSQVAELQYNLDGSIREVTHTLGGVPSTTKFSYEGGRITRAYTANETVAQYEYDARGRPVYARDLQFGERSYEYAGRAIRRFTVGYSALDLETNALGLLTGFSNHAQLAELLYDHRDQLRELRFNVDGQESVSQFEYDASGLRTAGTYRAGNEATTLTFGYDEVGNLTELFGATSDGQEGGQKYLLGENNQLTALQNNARPDLSFDYDFAGRPVAARFADQTVSYGYDELGRLSSVYREGEQVLEGHYGPMDLDVATEADGRAAEVSIGAPVASAIFGSLEAIAYSRTRGTPFGPVRFSPYMGRFILAKGLVPPPDSVVLTSFSRRALPTIASEAGGYGSHGSHGNSAAAIANPGPMGFDKPSNALFLPTEFNTINCFYCVAWVNGSTSGVYLSVNGTGSGTATAIAGQPASVKVERTGASPQCVGDVPTGYALFHHQFSNGAYIYSDGANIRADTVDYFPTPGSYTVTDYIMCGCYYADVFVAQLTRPVQVQQPPCTPPYQFHASNPYIGGVFESIERSGNLANGQITIRVRVDTLTESDFNKFKTWVEAAWNKHFQGVGVGLTVNVQLTRNNFVRDVRVRIPIEAPPGGPSNNPPPDNCGTFNRNVVPFEIIVRDNPACSLSTTAAHEFGHQMKFANAYLTVDNVCVDSLHCDSTDIMACGNQVSAYHAQLLWERL